MLLCSLGVQSQEFYLGADLSYVNELKDCDAVYRNRSGEAVDPYELFSEEGANIVRLRLWHDPKWTNYSNLEDIKISIGKAKANGMQVLLDFHYSDFWADPGRQWRPQAWEGIEDDELLGDSLYQYTYNTLFTLHQEGLLPEMVQIGNETNGNILIQRGETELSGQSPDLYPIDWGRQSMLMNHGIQAVQDIESQFDVDIKTMLHVANPIDARSWFEDASSNALVDYDIIGLSYYPQWHKLGVREVGEYIADFKTRFGKDVMIVETGYPWTSNSLDQANNVLNFDSRLFTYSNNFSIDVQRDFMIELSWIVKENGGLGVIYWEPAWISSSCATYWATGSHWENATLFDFDGQLHRGADFLSYDYDQMPDALQDQTVTFKVDMTSIETSNGVYVTGDFTGETNWQFLPMNELADNIFSYTTEIPGRSQGAYIFYNDDVWSNSSRETVPSNCARLWNTHREYWVKGEQAEFFFSWGRCDQVPNEKILGFQEDARITLFPTRADRELKIQTEERIDHLELFDIGGSTNYQIKFKDQAIDVSHLTPGVYLLRIVLKDETVVQRFVKN